jgi:hypothetical protein
MDQLRSNQITAEQKIILQSLAESVAREGVQFLEIGSWLGDSAIVLGKVAQKHKGTLVCVDWWKGNPGTGLEIIASHNDIFSKFWERVCNEGLEDTIIPIRARSEEALKHLKSNSYHLIFIDGDHRYQQTLLDINNCKDLVSNDGGILCGHDCEGYRSDFDEDFLEEGKDIDYHQTVHCGVVLAVSSVFDEYSINHSIWSTLKGYEEVTWGPTDPSPIDTPRKKQISPPIFASSENYNVIRYQKKIYAVPKDLTGFDITDIEKPLPLEVVTKNSYEEISLSLDETFKFSENHPTLLSNYKNFNLVSFNDKVYALHESVGKCDLQKIEQWKFEEHLKNNEIIIVQTENQAKELITYYTPALILPNYHQYNIVRYKNQFYGVNQKLGPIVNWKQFTSNVPSDPLDCLIGNSLKMVSNLIDQLTLTKSIS